MAAPVKPCPVLYVDHVTALSGGERSLVDLCRALDRARFRPVLACPGDGPLAAAFRALCFDVHFLTAAPGLLDVSRTSLDTSLARVIEWIPGTIAVARQVAAAARASGAQLIASNSQKAHVLASLAARMTGLPLVWHMRDCLEPGWAGRTMGLLSRLFGPRIIAISDAVVRSLARAGPFRGDRVVRVYNGLALPKEPGRPVLRHELPLPPDAFLVGTVGQISRWKGLHVLLEAARRMPRLHVAITGECLFTGNEAVYREELARIAAAPDLAGRVFFVGPREDIPDVMASLDLLVHPVIEPEPFGRVLVEAMAAGRPVVASDLGAVREVVGHEAGLLVPAGDHEALVRALGTLAGDPDARERMGQAGRARATAEFGIETCKSKIEAVYEDVLGAAR